MLSICSGPSRTCTKGLGASSDFIFFEDSTDIGESKGILVHYFEVYIC